MQIDKNILRNEFKNKRNSLSLTKRQEYDSSIFNQIIELEEFKNSNTLLCYVSFQSEVDTKELINYSLESKMKVAVPKSNPKDNTIKFYYIKSLDELSQGHYGVLEPIDNEINLCEEFSDSICVVPGLSFDKQNYRLGYGKGYYDRFLSIYNGFSIGVCYNVNIANRLVTNEFDKSVDLVITEK